jgi:hypothetical protein
MIPQILYYFGITGAGFILGYMAVDGSSSLKNSIGSPFVGGLIGAGIGFALTICVILFYLM